MSVHDILLNAGKHTNQLLGNSKLAQADRAKFSRPEIRSLVIDHILLGRLNTCEALLKTHRENPYKDVDDLIGDLQMILVKANDDLQKANYAFPIKVTIEDLIRG